MECSNPLPVLKSFVRLRQLTGMYPADHPSIVDQLSELSKLVEELLASEREARIDVIHGHVHLNGRPYHDDQSAHRQVIEELGELSIDSIHIRDGVEPSELRTVAEVLWSLRAGGPREPLEDSLERLNVRHVTVGRILTLDTRWRMQQWPDAPTGPLDPAYAEALVRAEQTFDSVASGQAIDALTVRQLVGILIHDVARSHVALSHILSLKAYENLTYCHSVNVAVLSLLLGIQIALDEPRLEALVEAALLHDIGKTRIPLDIVKKPGALDRAERKLIESHTIRGAELLSETKGLHPLTATVALEHHRGMFGGGYPDLGDGVVPHPLSQVVSVADTYEALTGARSYQDPKPPEQACLILARKAGTALNTALVKSFVAAVTFFPVGSLVRTNKGEVGVVTRTRSGDPLHPVVALVPAAGQTLERIVEVDTGLRDDRGEYVRHVVSTLTTPPEFDVAPYLGNTAPLQGMHRDTAHHGVPQAV